MGDGPVEPPTAELGATTAGAQPVPTTTASSSLGAGMVDGHGPDGAAGATGAYSEQAFWWQRPEAALGAAFVCGLLLAALLRRSRS
jgi:hypothetical protein